MSIADMSALFHFLIFHDSHHLFIYLLGDAVFHIADELDHLHDCRSFPGED